MGLFGEEPVGDVDNLDALVIKRRLVGAGEEELRVGIGGGKERSDFSLEGGGLADVGGNLDVEFFIGAASDEVDFAFAEGADVDFVATAEKLDGDNILVGVTEVEVVGAEFGVFEGVVTEVIFILRGEIGFALDVETADFIEGEGVTEVVKIEIDSAVADLVTAGAEGVGDAAAGGEVGDVVHQEVADFLEEGGVLDVVFLLNVADDEGVVDVADILVTLGLVGVEVGAGETAPIEVLV